MDTPKRPPHIVLIMADHLRWDCLSCYGDLKVATPHLDALAAESVIFDRAYCASPLCTPARVAMYTGKWPHTNGAIINGHHPGPEKPYGTAGPAHQTSYERLDQAGYQISHTGIQHCQLSPPLEARVPNGRFYDWTEWSAFAQARGVPVIGFREPAIKPWAIPNLVPVNGRPEVKMHTLPVGIRSPHAAEDYLDVFWSHQAERQIGQLDPARPQYVEMLFWAPHPPLLVPEPYFSMYPPESIELPETVGVWCEGQPASLLRGLCGMLGHTRTREEYRGVWSAYFGLVTMVDACIGRVVAALKARGIWDEALVIFTQDHGEMLGCHWLYQKNCFYEESARLPLLIKPPGGLQGRPTRRSQLASGIDYCPTVCDYAGISPPAGVQGMSLRPAIEHAAAPGREAVFMEYNGEQARGAASRAVVTERAGRTWKYIHTPGDVDELYDLTADPREKRSLVKDAESQEVRGELRQVLDEWMKRTGDFVRMEPRPRTRDDAARALGW